MSEIIIVSACLAGINCRYDGKNGKNDAIEKMVLSGKAIPLCPEILGGLDTPRTPCEITGSGENRRVFNKNGKNMTHYFKQGANRTLEIAKTIGASAAILKSRSPSCGRGMIYDGSFSGKLTEGNGFTADLLLKNSIRVFTEENFNE